MGLTADANAVTLEICTRVRSSRVFGIDRRIVRDEVFAP
jgi:hypothetical protein